MAEPAATLRIACILMALAFPALTAPDAAAFGDCARSGYFGSADERYRGAAVDCVEAEVIAIRTPAGSREIRIVHDRAYPASDLPSVLAQIREGVARSEAALLSIGEGTIDSMTVLASMLLPPEDLPVDEDELAGVTATGDGGCLLVIYPGVTGRGGIAYTFAHEFFHCVQVATQGRAKFYSGGDWWVEGTAEWFAALAFPDSRASNDFVRGFDEISPDTPLTSMTYEAVVFFFWLGQRFSPSMVMALMDAMPVRGAAAERQAVLSLLDEDDLLAFAQAYLDREIRRPGGGGIPSNPFPGDIYAWEESRTHEIEAEPFVLARAQLEFACGQWSLGRTAERGRWRVKQDGGDWMDLPEHLEIAGPGPDTYRLAAFGTEESGFRLELEAERDACRGCANLAADDEARRCLIGNWELVSGGYGEQIERKLKEQGILETVEYPEFFAALNLAEDGSYSTAGTTPHTLAVRSDEGELHVLTGNFTHESSGFWAIDGEELQLCEMEAHVVIDDELIGPEGDVQEIGQAGGPDSGPILRGRDFTCVGSTLVLVEDIPMTPTVTWTYSRR